MSSMQLKNSCRLCLSKEGEFYELFDATTLADELKSLLNFEIKKKENLPESICTLCYKINSFFKEFRDNCIRVNDYFNQVSESQKCPPVVSPVTIKTEKIDDLGDVSVGGSKNSEDEELVTRGNRAADCEETPYPVALVTSTYNKNLETLRSNFVSGRNLTDDALGNVPESETRSADVPSRRGKKRKNENFEDTQSSPDNLIPQDMLLATVKTEHFSSEDSEEQTDKFGSVSCLEENDTGEYSAEEDLYSSDVNSVRNNESAQDSGSNFLNGNVEAYNVGNLPERTLSGVGKGASEVHIRKKTKTMPVMENKGKSNTRTIQNSSSVGSRVDHLLKQEEVDLYEPPLEQSNNSASSDEQNSSDESYLSDSNDIDKGPSYVEDRDSVSSFSANSSEESDDDTEMLLLLALLM